MGMFSDRVHNNYGRHHHRQPFLVPETSVKPLTEKINKLKELLVNAEHIRSDGFFDLMNKKLEITQDIKDLKKEITQGYDIVKSSGARSLEIELQFLEVSNKIEKMANQGLLSKLVLNSKYV